MATPQKIMYGSWAQAWAPLVVASLAGLGLAHVWEFASVAAKHGGLGFVLAWLLCMFVLALPLRLMEIMLGRRSRRGLIEGMAFLTREADAPRFWRTAAWGGLLAAIAAMAGLALLAGWGFSFLVHYQINPVIYTASNAGIEWPLATGGVLLVAALLTRLGLLRLAPVYFGLWALVGALILAAAVPGINAASQVLLQFKGALGFAGWVEAARFALLSLGGGMGLLWVIGAYLPAERSVASVALPALLLQILLTALVGLAFSPVVSVAATLPGHSLLFDQLPAALTSRGLQAQLLFAAMAISALAALAAIGEVLKLFLVERGFKPLVAVIAGFVLVGVLAEGLWIGGAVSIASSILAGVRILLLLVLLGLSVYSGWAMKISHARKELGLPSELLYNLWRVAIRIVCPLAIILVLVGSL